MAEYVVGETYMVPCVMHTWGDGAYREWTPILEPPHADPDLRTPERHWHIDWRFVPQRLITAAGAKDPESSFHLMLYAIPETSNTFVSHRRMRCLRIMPTMPMHMHNLRHIANRLEDQYAGITLPPDCRTCPHRGTSLRGLPEVMPGVVVCPGHGLAWNLETGNNVPRRFVVCERMLHGGYYSFI